MDIVINKAIQIELYVLFPFVSTQLLKTEAGGGGGLRREVICLHYFLDSTSPPGKSKYGSTHYSNNCFPGVVSCRT